MLLLQTLRRHCSRHGHVATFRRLLHSSSVLKCSFGMVSGVSPSFEYSGRGVLLTTADLAAADSATQRRLEKKQTSEIPYLFGG